MYRSEEDREARERGNVATKKAPARKPAAKKAPAKKAAAPAKKK